MSTPDLSVVVNFHQERLNAYPTLRCINAAAVYATQMSINLELFYILDNSDFETTRLVTTYNSNAAIHASIVRISEGDLGAARNHGARIANGTVLAFCDGDDLYSRNWFSVGYHTVSQTSALIVAHPEYVVNFGMHRSYARQTDLTTKRSYSGLLIDNWWCSWTIARREIYIGVPYSRNEIATSGFGFEDWHWNCEVLSRGMSHVLAPRTAGYYRRSSSGLLSQSLRNSRLLRPTALFMK